MVHIKNKKQRERVEQATLYAEAKEKEIIDRIKYGAPVEEKSDDQLFYVSKSATNKKQFKDAPLTRAEKILAPNPNVEVVSKDVKQDAKVYKTLKTVEKKYEKINQNKKKELQLKKTTRIQRKQQREEQHKKKFELWGESKKEEQDQIIPKDNDFITNNLLKNRIPEKKKPNHPAVIKKVASIELPEPGMSYNPSYDDHQDTLGAAVAKEILAQDYIDSIDNKLNPEIIEYQDNGVEENTEFEPVDNKPTDRITKKEKNKRIRRAEEMKRQKAAKDKKLFNEQIDKVLETLQEVKEQEEIQKERREKRVEKKNQNTIAKRLGKYKVSELQEPVLLTNQLPKSFSSISNENYNPLKERYFNLQKRHIIEASGPQQKAKKAIRKVYTSNAWNNTTPASIDN